MERLRKQQIVKGLNDALNDAGMVVVARHNALTVAEANELRRGVRETGATFRVVKNRLALRALESTPYEALRDLFEGPSALTLADDPVAAAKATVDYAKKNRKLVVVGGAMPGTMLDAEGVRQLATLPSLDVLRATLAGLLNAPASRLASVLQAPARPACACRGRLRQHGIDRTGRRRGILTPSRYEPTRNTGVH